MKKLALTLTIIFGMTIGAAAQGGGLFRYGPVSDEDSYGAGNRTGLLSLPDSHGGTDDVQTPLGSGALLLIGFGAAYAWNKRKENHNIQ